MLRPALAAFAAALALAACNNKAADTTADDSAAEMATDNAIDNLAADTNVLARGEMAATISGTDYAANLASADAYEVEAAKIAQQRSKTVAIRAFAKTLETDHETAGADLKAAAAKASPAVVVDAAMTDHQKGQLDDLRTADANDFDAKYLDQQIHVHENTLGMLRDYAANGDIPALKANAATTAKVVERHLNRARQLDKSGADETAQ